MFSEERGGLENIARFVRISRAVAEPINHIFIKLFQLRRVDYQGECHLLVCKCRIVMLHNISMF